MELYTSYFYQVRHMQPWEVPLSTAVWDPKWFHDFKRSDYVFFDRNGVINGLRAEYLAPNDSCNGLCRGRENCRVVGYGVCEFFQRYREQLGGINIGRVVENLQTTAETLKQQMRLEHPVKFVFLVHEAPDNPCSERVLIQEWFRGYGYAIKEWQPTFQ